MSNSSGTSAAVVRRTSMGAAYSAGAGGPAPEPPALVSSVYPRPARGESGAEGEQRKPGPDQDAPPARDAGKGILERARREVRRDRANGCRERGRSDPQPAGVGQREVQEIRDRQSALRRRPVAERDA